MINKEKNTPKGNRIYFLDNLRTIIIFLVVLLHACGPYINDDMWISFWLVDDPDNNDVSGLVWLVLDIFMMATLFFVSGYLASASQKNKNGWTFIGAKFKRLIIPWIIAVFTLIPLYKVIFLVSRNLPQEHWTTYFHFSNPMGQNWLWFLPFLFAFNILYQLFSKTNIQLPNISLAGAVFGTFLVGFIYSIFMDLFDLRGWTHTPLIDFQNERVLIYFLFFLLGALCFKRKVFDVKPESKKLYRIVNSVAWIPIFVYIFFRVIPFVISPGDYIFSKVIDKSILWFCFHLSLLSIVYVMIQTAWRYFNKPGKIWNELNQNSYLVYIIHVIVLGGIALFLLDTTIPSLLKHLILTILTYLVSNVIISLYRKVRVNASS